MTSYFVIVEQAGNVRTYALAQLEQAGTYTLNQNIECDASSNSYVISSNKGQLQAAFQKRIQLNYYSINKFLVFNKGDRDPQGYVMSEPGLYIELSLPICGFDIPIGEDFVVPPYKAETRTWVK